MYETVEKELLAKVDALEKENAELKGKLRQKTEDCYRLGAELVEELGKNQELNARLHKDYENSSKLSSQKPSHKKIENSREKTGRKRGGLPGLGRHPRPRQVPMERVEIPPDDEMLDGSKYRPTGGNVTRQLVKLRVSVDVVEYSTPESTEKATGKRKHAKFPEGLENDVNYDGTVKAFLFLLNTECNASIHKTRDFLRRLTMGGFPFPRG